MPIFRWFSELCSVPGRDFLPSFDDANVHDVLHSLTPEYNTVTTEVYCLQEGVCLTEKIERQTRNL